MNLRNALYITLSTHPTMSAPHFSQQILIKHATRARKPTPNCTSKKQKVLNNETERNSLLTLLDNRRKIAEIVPKHIEEDCSADEDVDKIPAKQYARGNFSLCSHELRPISRQTEVTTGPRDSTRRLCRRTRRIS